MAFKRKTEKRASCQPSPEMWLRLQQDVDLWDTHHARRKEYERIKRVATSKAA